MLNSKRNGITKIESGLMILVLIAIVISAIPLYTMTNIASDISSLSEKIDLLTQARIEDVRVGVLISLTGPYAYTGEDFLHGTQLAVREINEAGGIESLGGAKIRLVVYDVGFTAEETVAATYRLALEDIVAITGRMTSGQGVPASEITERAKIPLLATCWADQFTERGLRYLFRPSLSSSQHNYLIWPTVIDLIKEATGTETVKLAFLHDYNPAAQGASEALQNMADEGLFEYVLEETWAPPLTDATPVITKLINSGAHTFHTVIDNLADNLLVFSKLHEMGGTAIPVLSGCSGLNKEFKAALGDLTEGMLVASDWNLFTGLEEMEADYLQFTGETFLPKDAGIGYGQMYIIKEALEASGSRDPKVLNDVIHELDLTEGIAAKVFFGRVKFDANGELESGRICVVQWQGDKPETVYPSEFATATIKPLS